MLKPIINIFHQTCFAVTPPPKILPKPFPLPDFAQEGKGVRALVVVIDHKMTWNRTSAVLWPVSFTRGLHGSIVGGSGSSYQIPPDAAVVRERAADQTT